MAEVKIWLSLETKSRTLGGQASKSVESPFAVAPGMMIEDFAWKQPRAVKSVSFSTDTPDVLSVYMGLEVAESDQHFRLLEEGYEGHGWTVKVYGESKE